MVFPKNKEHLVMAVINITPDSFYEKSRCLNDSCLKERLNFLKKESFDILDIGSFSSRPNGEFISTKEELNRLIPALEIITEIFPNTTISIDTFRSEVAEECIKRFNIEIINDISGGSMDKNMYKTVSKYQKTYVLTHIKGTPQTMFFSENTSYKNLLEEMLIFFEERIKELTILGCKNIIIDPGFGFAKTTMQNYTILKNLHLFKKWGLPLMVGFSRKSMIWKILNSSPENALNGTTILNTLALTHGANILRVHDTKEANETIKLFKIYNNQTTTWRDLE